MDRWQRQALDRYITGNWGEDSVVEPHEVEWTCPNCGTVNRDDQNDTAMPMCSSCEEVFFWGDVLPDQEDD